MKKFIYLFTVLILIAACKPNANTINYKTEAMLKNVAENIILPNYTLLQTNISELNDAVLDLKNTANSSNLTAAQNKFLEAYKAYQKCSPYQFGPAVDVALHTINIYPTDTSKINNNISSGTYNLETASNIAASGFPALDYLLFYGNESEILSRLANTAYTDYMIAVSQQMDTKATEVKNAWVSTYKNTFMTATDQSVGGSVGILTNAMILDFEKNAREAKIGIPAGVRTLNQIIPGNVEALYSKNSVLLAKEHLAGVSELYEGKNGESFKALLISVGKETLANNITTHLSDIETALNTLTDPFSDMLISSNQKALTAYGEYQKLLPLLKVDMTAALALLITYADSDGD